MPNPHNGCHCPNCSHTQKSSHIQFYSSFCHPLSYRINALAEQILVGSNLQFFKKDHSCVAMSLMMEAGTNKCVKSWFILFNLSNINPRYFKYSIKVPKD